MNTMIEDETEVEKDGSTVSAVEPLIPCNLSATMERTDNTSGKVPATPDHPITAPFGQYSMCNSREETANTVAVIIADRLGFDDVREKTLVTALQSYFAVAEATNHVA